MCKLGRVIVDLTHSTYEYEDRVYRKTKGSHSQLNGPLGQAAFDKTTLMSIGSTKELVFGDVSHYYHL
jgi:hypothetical protein